MVCAMGSSVSGWVNSFICLEEASDPWAGEGAGLCEAPPGGSEIKATQHFDRLSQQYYWSEQLSWARIDGAGIINLPLSMTDTLMILGKSFLVVMILDVVNNVGLWNNSSLLYNSSLSWLEGFWCLDFCINRIALCKQNIGHPWYIELHRHRETSIDQDSILWHLVLYPTAHTTFILLGW